MEHSKKLRDTMADELDEWFDKWMIKTGADFSGLAMNLLLVKVSSIAAIRVHDITRPENAGRPTQEKLDAAGAWYLKIFTRLWSVVDEALHEAWQELDEKEG